MADETTPETATNAAPEAAEAAPDRVAALEAEVQEFRDRTLRTLAEMENLRKRTEREMADARQYAVANFARDMLNVADNLRRAIDAIPGEQKDAADPALAALIEGVEVTERGLAQTLQKFGIRAIDAKGQKFDPTRHQAMFEIEDAALPAGTVAEVMQTGYVIGDRVLRPAMVGVAKGGPKTVPDETKAAPDAKAAAEKAPQSRAGEAQPAGDSAG